MRVLVTGGAGFIGSHLVDGFLREGYEVAVADNLSTGKRENLNPKAEFYAMDICDPDLEGVFRDGNFDYVNHHAAQIDVRRSVADPLFDAQVNILGLLNLLENCRKYSVKGFVLASSGGVVYGEPQKLPAAEIFPKGPQSPYGVSKLASEFYLNYYAQVRGLSYITLRYGNVYGPRQDPHGEAGVVAIFGLKMLKGEAPTIFGDGEQLRDYVYVGDVARANLLALKYLEKGIIRSAPGGCAINDYAYNIGTGKGTSVNELFSILKESAKFVGEAEYGPERTGELKRIYLDAAKAKDVLGWAPETRLHEGLLKTVEYLAKRG